MEDGFICVPSASSADKPHIQASDDLVSFEQRGGWICAFVLARNYVLMIANRHTPRGMRAPPRKTIHLTKALWAVESQMPSAIRTITDRRTAAAIIRWRLRSSAGSPAWLVQKTPRSGCRSRQRMATMAAKISVDVQVCTPGDEEEQVDHEDVRDHGQHQGRSQQGRLSEEQQRCAGQLDQSEEGRVDVGVAVEIPNEVVAAQGSNRPEGQLRWDAELPAKEFARSVQQEQER
jgi:hypothetical protein